MPDLAFSVPECNLMLALVHLRGSGTTAAFKVAFDFDKVETTARRSLTEQGLIAIDKSVRPYVYELTDAGWLATRKLLAEPSPKKVSSRTARILWAIMGDFSAHMDRTGAELADLYPPPAAPAPQETQETHDPQEAVHRAYRELVGETTDWVPLRRLREHLGETDRETLDQALTELLASHAIRLIPESNQKTLTQADRDAAIWLGGQYQHLIAIEAR